MSEQIISVELTLDAEDLENILHWEKSHAAYCYVDCHENSVMDGEGETADDRTLAKIVLAKEKLDAEIQG